MQRIQKDQPWKFMLQANFFMKWCQTCYHQQVQRQGIYVCAVHPKYAWSDVCCAHNDARKTNIDIRAETKKNSRQFLLSPCRDHLTKQSSFVFHNLCNIYILHCLIWTVCFFASASIWSGCVWVCSLVWPDW